MVGLEKILIPLKEEDLSLEKIQEYLPAIMEVFDRNARKARANYEKFKGQHNILQKTRPYGDIADINNKVVEQHLWAMNTHLLSRLNVVYLFTCVLLTLPLL